MTEDARWAIGILATFTLAFVSAVLGGFIRMFAKHSKTTSDIYRRIEEVEKNAATKDDVKTMVDHLDKRLDDHKADSTRRHEDLKDFIKAHLSN